MAALGSPGGLSAEIVLIILLIVSAGFFAGSETALSACNRIRIRQLADDGKKAAVTACRIIDDFDRAIVVVLIATNVCHTLAASVAAIMFIGLLGDVGTLVSTVLITLTVFIFADMLPKSIAKERCDSFVLFCAYPLFAFMKLLYPLSSLFTLISGVFKKAHTKSEPVYTDDELQDIVETVEEEGVFEPEESEIICSAIEFGDLLASDIYLPCEKVVSLSVNTPDDEIKEQLISVKYSRIPLYRDDPYDFIGFLRAEEYLVSLISGSRRSIRKFISPPRYVAFDTPLASVFESMGKYRTHLMFVRDGEGRTIGIITMEDLLESIVGDINDSDDGSALSQRRDEA